MSEATIAGGGKSHLAALTRDVRRLICPTTTGKSVDQIEPIHLARPALTVPDRSRQKSQFLERNQSDLGNPALV
jgi:hypothetical protein